MNAPEILKKAAQHMEARADTYDKPGGERSMAQTVAIFNLFHGTALTEAQGWHFMQILKDVRLFARPDSYHADSGEDGTAYSALKCEAMAAHSEAQHAATAPVVIPPAKDTNLGPESDIAARHAAGIDTLNAGPCIDVVAALDVVAANAADDGWIEWGGGECPVPDGTEVQVQHRDGSVFRGKALIDKGIGNSNWHIGFKADPRPCRRDIIAYRVIKTN